MTRCRSPNDAALPKARGDCRGWGWADPYLTARHRWTIKAAPSARCRCNAAPEFEASFVRRRRGPRLSPAGIGDSRRFHPLTGPRSCLLILQTLDRPRIGLPPRSGPCISPPPEAAAISAWVVAAKYKARWDDEK